MMEGLVLIGPILSSLLFIEGQKLHFKQVFWSNHTLAGIINAWIWALYMHKDGWANCNMWTSSETSMNKLIKVQNVDLDVQVVDEEFKSAWFLTNCKSPYISIQFNFKTVLKIYYNWRINVPLYLWNF